MAEDGDRNAAQRACRPALAANRPVRAGIELRSGCVVVVGVGVHKVTKTYQIRRITKLGNSRASPPYPIRRLYTAANAPVSAPSANAVTRRSAPFRRLSVGSD